MDNFKHEFADLGEVTLHYVTVGDGDPVVLLHGWPQTWYEWRLLMPLMARDFKLMAPDLRGLGQSSRPVSGYSKKIAAEDIWALMHDHLGYDQFHLVGHDVGGPVAYHLAVAHPEAIQKLVIVDVLVRADLLKGASRSAVSRWHHGFNQIVDMPEALTQGREGVYLGWFYKVGGARPDALMEEAQAEYIRSYSQPGAMRAGFNYYRAFPTDYMDNQAIPEGHKLPMPLLGLSGGAKSGRRDLVRQSLENVADDVTAIVVEDAGHWLPEEQPEEMARHLTAFFNR